MAPTDVKFYWTDDKLNSWDDVDGVVTYGPTGGFVAFACSVPGDGIAVFGDNAGSDALGWRTTDALVETNDTWVPEDGSGDWTLPDTDVVEGYFSTSYDGDGATFDPDTGYIFVTGIFRRFDMPGYTNQREHNIIVVDPATDTVVDSDVISFESGVLWEPTGIGSHGEGGQCALGRKLYYSCESGSDSIVEYDMDTGTHRKSTNCFDSGRTADVFTRPGDATGLWLLDESGWNSPFDVYLRRFEADDIPWGVTGTPATPTDEIVLFRDNGTAIVESHVNTGCFISANEIVYQGDLVSNGHVGWFRQVIDPLGDPELVVDLGSSWYSAGHSDAYTSWSPTSAWPLHVVRTNGAFYRVGPDENPDGGLLRFVTGDGTRYVQDRAGDVTIDIVAPNGDLLTALPASLETRLWTFSDTRFQWEWDAGEYLMGTFADLTGYPLTVPAGATYLEYWVVPAGFDMVAFATFPSPGSVASVDGSGHHGPFDTGGSTPSAGAHLWVGWSDGTDSYPGTEPPGLVPAALAADGTA